MITFTVPEKIRAFIRSHQRPCYTAMFAASSQTLKKLVRDEKFIGADLPGFFGVLHTWGRKMPYHPHIHYIAPGGALSKSDQRWRPSRKDFFLPVRAMSKIFKAKFLDEMQKCGLASKICRRVLTAAGNSYTTLRFCRCAWRRTAQVNLRPLHQLPFSKTDIAPLSAWIAVP